MAEVLIVQGFFEHCLRLTSELGLVRGQILAFHEDAVSRHSVSRLKFNQVTYDQLLRVNRPHCVVPADASLHNIAALHELLELGFFGEVIADSDDDNDNDGYKDRHAVDPAESEPIVVDADDGGNDGCDAENLQNEILKHIRDQLAN